MSRKSFLDRFMLPDGSLPPLRGADPVADPPADVMPRVRELGQQITTKRTEAAAAWTDFEAKRTELASSPDATNVESDLFKETEAASQSYTSAADEVRSLEEARDRLLTIGTVDAPRAGNGPQDGDRGLTVAGALLPEVRHNAAQIAMNSEGYQRLQASRAFFQEGRKSVEEVLIESGGESERGLRAREHLLQALQSGGPVMASLVTGGDPTSGGALVVPQRLPGITVPLRFRPLRMVDLITVGTTDSDTVDYVEMTGFTNNAAETAEATATSGSSGTKPESAMALEKRTKNVENIAHWIPATKRSLADAGQLRTLIEGILALGLDLRLDGQIANGNGQGSNLRGIYNTVGIGEVEWRKAVTGNTNTPETILETIHRAITVVRLAFFEPTAIGIHPNDYERVRLARSGKAPVANQAGTAGSYGEGEYLMGDPDTAGAERIWGLMPVVSAAFEEGHPLIGDYRMAVLWLREAMQILASDSHMDFFIRNMVALLAEFRAAFGVLAPSAFCGADIS